MFVSVLIPLPPANPAIVCVDGFVAAWLLRGGGGGEPQRHRHDRESRPSVPSHYRILVLLQRPRPLVYAPHLRRRVAPRRAPLRRSATVLTVTAVSRSAVAADPVPSG